MPTIKTKKANPEVRFTFSLPLALRETLSRQAAKKQRSLSATLRAEIQEIVDRQISPPTPSSNNSRRNASRVSPRRPAVA